ncbi:hypothetical protein VPH35_069783 [Triticum aestivum]
MAVEESGKWMMKSCTAAKSTEAGNQASVRMAAAGSSYMEMEGEQLPEGRIDLSMSTAQEQAGSYDPLGAGRGEAAIDKMLVEANLSVVFPKKSADGSIARESAWTRSGPVRSRSEPAFGPAAGGCQAHLGPEEDDLPSIDYLDDLAELYTPDLELFKKIDYDFEVYKKQVRDSVQSRGYFEVDYDYFEGRKKINAWTKAQWAKIKEDVKITVCAPDADQATLGYIDYVDSEYDNDASSDSDYDDDSESQDED